MKNTLSRLVRDLQGTISLDFLKRAEKQMQAQGFDQNTVAEKLKMQSFIVRNYLRQARSFRIEELKAAVRDCVDAEEAVKTGRMNDVMSVEILIVKYSA